MKEPNFKTSDIVSSKSQYKQTFQVRTQKMQQFKNFLGKHYKILMLYVISVAVLAVAVFVVVGQITRSNSTQSQNTENNSTSDTTSVEITNPELSINEVEADCLSKPATGEDYAPTFIACMQKYIDATSDNSRLSKLYSIRASYLMTNKVLQTSEYNDQILQDYLKIEDIEHSVSSANNLMNFARITQNTELYAKWNQVYNERWAQQNQYNGEGGDGTG